jgi:hypothetical protein
MKRWYQTLLVSAMIWVSSPGAAQGAPAPGTADFKRARSEFFAGEQQFRAGNYPVALTHFIASYKLLPKPVVVFNIGMCHRALFAYKRSIAAFQSYLASGGTHATRKRRAQIQRLIQEMEGKLGRITLSISPDGAEVKVDGEVAGTSPLTGPVTVDPGKRVLEVLHPGFVAHRQEVDVTDGQVITLEVKLVKILEYGFLTVVSAVPGALARVDEGAPLPVPLYLKLAEGSHRVRITAPDHEPLELTVTVRPNEIAKAEARLVPRPKPRTRIVPLVAPPRPEPPVQAPPPRRRFYQRAWFWVLMTAVVAGAGTTAGYFGWTLSQPRDDFDRTLRLR